ncbi:MAG: nucleotidyl transferase AbiEii/AbiGii toxin family protein [Deltaproteobacteria bacterium]|nr:nucleotidyl transferase AbiEii/AbiGii toxin family protein [Deltaproteobacteria bacterium]
MSHRYATPAAFKAAIEQRLRNHAQQTGISLERYRQLLVFDRFLARVFQVFVDSVVLKGGLVVELRIARARTTKDVDLRVTGRPDLVIDKLQAAGRLDLDDYMNFEVMKDAKHPEIETEGMVYAGKRFRVEARLAGKIYGRPFGVDVAFADALTEEPDHIIGSSFLEFAGIAPLTYRVYPLATHIAEKLHAYTLPRSRPNSRVKDLPDMVLLAGSRSLNAGDLSHAIVSTFAHRKTHEVPTELPSPPPDWKDSYAAMAAQDDLPWRSLESVFEAAKRFLEPVLQSPSGTWNPEQWKWQ